MTEIDLIHTYFKCFKERDLETLRSLLKPDFRHVSPYGLYENRDKMLADIWPMVGRTYACDIEIFGTGPTYMVRYRHSGQTRSRLAEFFRFEGGQIAEIEVYLGKGAVPASDEP